MSHQDRPLTAQLLLYGGESLGGAASDLAQSLRAQGATGTTLDGIHHLSRAACRAADDQVGQAAADLLDIDLGDALIAGWCTYSALTSAAQRTLATSSREVVALASHRITSAYRPQVDLLVDGVRVHRFRFELTMFFDVIGLAAVVAAGQLVELRGGSCHVTLELTVDHLPLRRREHDLDLQYAIRLDPPRQLATSAATAAATPSRH